MQKLIRKLPKCFANSELRMADSNPAFMINLDKYNGTCNTADDLSPKICVPSETKDVKYLI